MSVLSVQVDVNRIVTTLLVDITVHVIMDSPLKVTVTAVQVGIGCTTILLFATVDIYKVYLYPYIMTYFGGIEYTSGVGVGSVKPCMV